MSSKIPFRHHLRELYSRILISFASILVASVGIYITRDRVLDFLIRPLHQPLYYTSPGGGLDFLFKVCVFFGCILALPVVIYNILKFIEPITNRNIHRFIFLFLGVSCLLSLVGMSFAYFVTLPATLQFLATFNRNTQVRSLITADEYFSFVSQYVAGFGFLFQLPLIIYIIHTIHPLTPKMLLGYLRYVILISFIVAAILTPTPDILNQLFMAVPLVSLYVISILIIWFARRKIDQY